MSPMAAGSMPVLIAVLVLALSIFSFFSLESETALTTSAMIALALLLAALQPVLLLVLSWLVYKWMFQELAQHAMIYRNTVVILVIIQVLFGLVFIGPVFGAL